MGFHHLILTAVLASGAVVIGSPFDLTARAVGDACKADEGDGTCKSVQDCNGISHPEALCPNDPSNVMCCVEVACKADGVDGTCRSTGQSCPGGNFAAGDLCPGGDDIQCCVPDPSATETVPQKVLAKAETAAGLPYAWGGGSCDGPSGDGPPYDYGDVGFDCSGLVCWAICSVTGRDLFTEGLRNTRSMYCASDDALKYQRVPLAERQLGDLIFFGGACDCDASNSIHHVGIMMDDDDRFFNAPNDDVNKVLESSVSGFGEEPCPSVIRIA